MPEPRPEEPGFTFVDKRRRGEAAEAAPEPTAPAPEPPLRRGSGSRPSPPGPVPPSALDRSADRSGAMGPSLTSLCAMFYSEALIHLGQAPDPVSGQPHVDLEQARFTIDMLSMLKSKTEGNRTAEETAVLDEVLSALRMVFVRLSRRQ